MDQEILNNFISEKLSETQSLLEENLFINNTPIEHRDIYYGLITHINNFLKGYKENRFITLTGLRGLGKTTVLFQLYEYLTIEKNISKNNVLYLPTDELVNYAGADLYEAINTFIMNEHYTSPVFLDKELFILIDEAQYDKKWSLAGKIIHDKSKKIFLIFTGSSALNFEMNVDAVRRIKKESIFPMNFQEYNFLKNNIISPKNYDFSLYDLIFNNGNLNKAIKKEKEMKNSLLNLNNPLNTEWEKFLLWGDFPFSLQMNKEEVYNRIFAMINKIIEKDVLNLKSFNSNMSSTISQIITYIALQDPGGTSDKKLATILSKSQKSIREILNILEKTHLLFAVRPYGSGGKQLRKPWKYYFLSPAINIAIRYKMGGLRINERKYLGILVENFVASYFFKYKQNNNPFLNIYYDPGKNGVDFLLETINGIIPVEVSIGKKDKKQISQAIKRYKSKQGIIISNTTSSIKKEEDIIYIPLHSLG
ncbi:ATP-binding protein [Methanobrevibacter curvatus]|uniref:AAA domain-containing protein n=1 Tax=Methanobrevibacter curvatus TaxID=49547 RepID=A0A162FMA6_9EURY|nr:AAA family ATPase [Methanobrevibacter curvatus]KZX12140.1 hypothetical protein MBCUR_11490 [Methanobrevibacter curvatus]